MFPDSEIARKFACGRTKYTAIVKEALGPHYNAKVVAQMPHLYSILIDESRNDLLIYTNITLFTEL